MKKSLLLLAHLFPLASCLSGQTLTSAGYKPLNNESFSMQWAPYSNTLIPTGVNQTWDFSSTTFTSPAPPYSFIAISDINFTSPFTGANTIRGHLNRQYLNVSNGGIELIGYIENLADTSKYSDPKKLLSYPMSYGDTYSDAWTYTRRVNSVTYTTSGTYSVSVVGTGTIITPDSKNLKVGLGNVLMLQMVESSVTYSSNISNPTSTLNTVSYRWYVYDLHEPIITIRNIYHNVFYPVPSGSRVIESFVFPQSFLSLNESIAAKSKIYPIPANKNFTVELPLNGGYAQLDIYDSQGKLIKSETTYTKSLKISTANWQPGVYFLRIASGEFVETKKMVIIN